MRKKLTHIFIIFFFSWQYLQASVYSSPGDSLRQINWIQLDPADDSIAGISLYKAYNLLQGKPSKTVLVAIIDSGVDIDQEDLKDNIWVNKDEIPDNGIDDDGNGYIDDIHGWNFQGGKDSDVVNDTYELTREYVRLSKIYNDKREGKGKEYEYWQKIKSTYEEDATTAMEGYENYKEIVHDIPRYFSLVKNYLDKDTLKVEYLDGITSDDSVVNEALSIVKKLLDYYGDNASLNTVLNGMNKGLNYYENQVKYGYNQEFNPRTIVGDDYLNPYQRNYGNNHCWIYSGNAGTHGTHVSGIVAANRHNDIGTNGIADNVKIISIRTVPNGDERDKDVANAIYYAVNNGAKVINMSFGKDYSPYREAVEKAIRYAGKKGVILVHAAGNDGKDIDTGDDFPTKKFIKGKKEAWNMIEVGASSQIIGAHIAAPFSNYGRERVDLFAPGVNVWSTMPNQSYKPSSGTSMAAPVVTGVVALLMEYFPQLSPQEIREIIVNSTWQYKGEVYKPGSKDEVAMDDLCSSGGIINAYNAVKLALNTIKLENR